jgi:hypothetical protein
MSAARRRSAWVGSVAGPVAAALLVATPALAAVATDDQTQLVRVTQSSTDASTGWIEQAYDCTVNEPFTTPNQDYVQGPGTPTLGAGSHVLRTGEYGEETELYRTAQFDGTKASDIAHLSYATWASSTKSSDTVKKEPAYLRLSFDTDGDSQPDTYLYYEPSINNTTTDDTWQNWDTMANGQQWSNGGGQDAGSLTTLQDFATANPTATLADNGNGGGVALIAGCSGQNQENGLFGVDRFAITTADQSQLFDFDPSVDSAVDNVTVTDDAPHGWNAAAYNDTVDLTPNQGMAFGPGTPPAGIGSHRMTLGNDPNEVEIWRSPELDGVNVGDIRTLNYSTYEKPGANAVGVQQPAYMRLSIDPGDGSGQINLFYEPSIDHSDNIANNAWQTWNTADELWSTDGGPDNLTTLAAVSAKHPDATVYTPANAAGNGGLSLVVGGSGDTELNSDFYVDNVETDYFHGAQPDTDRTFDFEPTVPAPSINVPSVVTGRSTIAITGDTNTGTAAPVALYEKAFGQSDFTKVDETTAADDGTYTFHRTVTKQSSFFVRSYDRTDSATKTVKVRIAVGLTLTSPKTGKLNMSVRTSPHAVGETVKFYRLNRDGTHTLLATRTTGSRGGAHATINYPSGHRVTVYATVTPPRGNLKGRSANESIRVS